MLLYLAISIARDSVTVISLTTDFKDSNHELYVAWEPVNKIRSEIKEVIS